MIILIALSVFVVFAIILFAKYARFDRGMDKKTNVTQNVIIGSEPYVPPEVDSKIKEEMETLQQLSFPVQYIDNGILSEIPSKSKEVSEVLSGSTYEGPQPFLNDVGTLLENVKSMETTQIGQNVVPQFDDNNDVIPYNSIDNVIASSQDVAEFESEDV